MPKTSLSFLSLITVAVALLAAGATAGAASATPDAARQAEVALPALDARILVRLNRIRTAHGLLPLRLNAGLEASSVQHSRDMGAQGYFAHTSLDGTTFWDRIKPVYTAGHPAASLAIGENLLWSSPRVQAGEAVRTWMHSPEHRSNILAPGWREIGVGAVRFSAAAGVFGGQSVTIITTDFGSRA